MTGPIPLTMSRRCLLGRAGLSAFGALPWPTVALASSDDAVDYQSLEFTAFRNGSRLGFHHVDFSRLGEQLVVDIEIAFDVKLAFIPFYRYRHRNREIWEDGNLVSLTSQTDDNGEDYQVTARMEGDRLTVDGADGQLSLPRDTPTTSYWNEAAILRGAWIDTQRGQLVRSEVTSKPAEPVGVAGKTLEAKRYDLAGDITCSLWYANGRWVKLVFLGEDGSDIEYAIDAPQQNG